MEKRFSAKEKAILSGVFDYLNPVVWTHCSTATVSLDNGSKYFIKKVENGYRYKWINPNIYEAMKDNSPLIFIDSLEKLNGGYTGGAF